MLRLCKSLLAALFLIFAIAACRDSTPNVAPEPYSALSVYKVGDSVYVRSQYTDEKDKVFRIKVGDSVTDFLGERSIPSSSGNMVSAFVENSQVLREGGEESPPIWANRKIVGGNHTLNGLETVHNYTRRILLDDSLLEEDGVFDGNRFVVEENYDVSFGDGVIFASIANVYSFNGGVYCNFDYTLSTKAFLSSLTFGAAQFQKPYASDSETLKISAENTKWEQGINLEKSLSLDKSLWTNPFIGPKSFVVTTAKNGVPSHEFLMEYDRGVQDDRITQSIWTSAATKIYPRAVEDTDVKAGTTYRVKGKFGVRPAI